MTILNNRKLALFIFTIVSCVNHSIGQQTYYIRDVEPFNHVDSVINTAWGAGNYTIADYSINPDSLFSSTTRLIYMEGSGTVNPVAMQSFLDANRKAMEQWVSEGGVMFLNAHLPQPFKVDFGFGGNGVNSLIPNYDISLVAWAVVGQENHPMLRKPFWLFCGLGSFGIGLNGKQPLIEGPGTTRILVGRPISEPQGYLSELKYGKGLVVFGALSASKTIIPPSRNLGRSIDLIVNILTYTRDYAYKDIDITSEPGFFACSGNTFDFTYKATGHFDSTNLFTAQLSDITGSFASPINIGTFSPSLSSTITATIPTTGILSGNTYRIRVVSTSPVSIGKSMEGSLRSRPVVTVPDVYVLGAGVTANTAYSGLEPASRIILHAEVSGDTANYPYQYLWSGGSTSSSFHVDANLNPPGNYIVHLTVLNSFECRTTIAIPVKIIDIRCGKNLSRISICHKNENLRQRTLCIRKDKVAEHLLHGDFLGACASKPSEVNQTLKTTIEEPENQPVRIKVFPNPSSQNFTLQFENFNSGEKLNLRTFDIYGRLIETRNNLNAGRSIQLGNNYKPGTYVIEITQGKLRKSITVMKAGN